MAILDIGCFSNLQTIGLGNFSYTKILKALAELELEAFGEMKLSVKVSQVFALTKNKIRIVFDSPMNDDEELISPDNYILEPISSNGVQLYYEEIEPENISYPNYIDVICSEMTDSILYQATVLYGPTSKDNSPIDPNNNTISFTGKGEKPTVLRLETISPNRVDVIFSEPMLDNEDIKNLVNYSFDNGLNILEILEVDGDRVKLVTTDQDPGVLYTLTIN